jgi:hypothetical protein
MPAPGNSAKLKFDGAVRPGAVRSSGVLGRKAAARQANSTTPIPVIHGRIGS